MKRTSTAAALLVALLLTAGNAAALVPPEALEGESGLRVEGGEPARTERTLVDRPPHEVEPRLAHFQRMYGPGWRGRFDPATRVPAHLFGGRVDAPGSVRSPERAESVARSVLAAHLDLLAPGASVEDFVLVSNTLDDRDRTVGFAQRHRGLEVIGGQLSFRFKNDRLFVISSAAVPDVSVEPSSSTLSRREAETKAKAWITRDFGGEPKASQVGGPVVLSIVRASGGIDHHRVVEVIVESKTPVARFSVYVDATTGALIARRQTLRFAEGTLRLNAAERNPETVRLEVPADALALVVRGATVTTDRAGAFTWTGSSAVSSTARASGPEVRVFNEAGPAASKAFILEPGGVYVWDAKDDELIDAQLTTFAATSRAKRYVRELAPELRWLEEAQIKATVNLDGACNAFSDGETINFFRAGRGCQNTGRIPDVVFHEFGHSVHAHAIIEGAGSFDGALSEGASDYLAATMTNDHAMGRGFRLDDRALRDLDPENDEDTWPADIGNDPHRTGMIFGGAMWDLRKALIAALGESAGVARADRLWYAVLQRAVDIPSSYVEVLAADDDDGDLGNGTPNVCAIHEAFSRHGLAEGTDAGPRIGEPKADGLAIRLEKSASLQCPSTTVASAEIAYTLRGDDTWSGTLSMTSDGRGFGATLPTPPRSNVVIRFRVTVDLMDGSRRVFPDNEADPEYETYVGTVTPLYCTTFENDPMVEGWTHALTAGVEREGADDWMWGPPQGTAGSGDPARAFSGTSVFGNDLGGGNYNGKYQPEKTNVLVSPQIDLRGFGQVRLQYRRWLTVEDGFFDRARILADDAEVWSNLATDANGAKHHQDREWRFQDVDLTGSMGTDGLVVKFELTTDASFDLGGWTVDDFCVVGVDETPRCGDGVLLAGEACDDGNGADGDGCSTACAIEVPPRCGDGRVDPGETCDDGNTNERDGCASSCAPGPTAACGDGIVDAEEDCDDGVLDGTACAPGCVSVAAPGATPPAPPGSEDEGCGCDATRRRPLEGPAPALDGVAVGLLLLALLRMRRRS